MYGGNVVVARRQLREPQPGTPSGDLEDEDRRLLAQFAMRAKMSPVRAEYGLDVHRVVIQDFLACVEDEVSIQRGDCVRELFRDGHWMFIATTAGQTGFIPATYCKPMSALINLPKSNTPSPAISRKSSESSSVFHRAGSQFSIDQHGSGNIVSDASSQYSARASQRRRGAASPSRLLSQGVQPADWGSCDSPDSSRAPSRSQTIRNRISLLAALGEDDLAKQREDLQQAAGTMTPSSGGSTPGYTSTHTSPGKQFNGDSSPGSPFVSPGKSLDTAMAAAECPRQLGSHLSHFSQHDILATPQCARRVTSRGRQSRRISQASEIDLNSRPASAASLPAVQKRVRLAYHFQANKEGELSLRNGEEVTVICEQGKDWLLVASDDGRRGLVPACLTITVSAVHAPHSGRKSNSASTLGAVRRNATDTSGACSTDSAIATGDETGEDGSDSPGHNASTSGEFPVPMSSSPAGSSGSSGSFDGKSTTLTPSTREYRNASPAPSHSSGNSGKSYYEDLYNFSHGQHESRGTTSSPAPGPKRRSRSASRSNLQRIAVDGSSLKGEPSPVHSDSETSRKSSGNSISKLFGRKSTKGSSSPKSKSVAPEKLSSSPPIPPKKNSGPTSEPFAHHGWRTSEPAYHRQRSRSASRSGMNRVDGTFTLEPLPVSSPPPMSKPTPTSAQVQVALGPNGTLTNKPIPIGNAAVFTSANTSYSSGPVSDNVDQLKRRMRSATLQPGSRPPTAPQTPARSTVHTRSSSFDEGVGGQRQLRVLFNYTAMVGEELDVKANCVVLENSTKSKPGWAWVTIPGTKREGYIPLDFTEPYISSSRNKSSPTTCNESPVLEKPIQTSANGQPKEPLCTTI